MRLKIRNVLKNLKICDRNESEIVKAFAIAVGCCVGNENEMTLHSAAVITLLKLTNHLTEHIFLKFIRADEISVNRLRKSIRTLPLICTRARKIISDRKIICMMLKFVSSLQKEIVPKWEQKFKNKEKCAEIGILFDF